MTHSKQVSILWRKNNMAIQSSINSMLGTAAGAMTAVVAKAKMLDDKTVSDQANMRAMQIAEERRRKRRLYGINLDNPMGKTNELPKPDDSHHITVENPDKKGYSKEERRATAILNFTGR